MATQGKILVYKRNSKKGFSYTYRIEAGKDPITGKRRCITKSGFKNAKEARAAAQPILNKLLLGENIIESNITFNEYAEQWFKEHSTNLKPNTKKTLKRMINVGNKYFAHIKMKNITLYQYQSFLNDYAKGRKKSTLMSVVIYMKRFFSDAVKFGVIKYNITQNATLPKTTAEIQNIEDLYLTKEEIYDVLNYLKTTKFRVNKCIYYICLLLIYTGIRVGEACALRWEDIDFNHKTIYINSTLFGNNIYNYIRQKTPKTLASIRTIPIGDFLLKSLKEWRQLQLTLRIRNATQNKRDATNYVFTKYFSYNDYEKPMLAYSVAQVFVRINRKHIFKKHLHAHIFRHTHASLLAQQGIPLEVIQERLGHSSDATTSKIYLHVTQKSKINAAKVFEEYMSM